MMNPQTELSKGGDKVLLVAQRSIEAAVEATAKLNCDSDQETIKAVIRNQEDNLTRALGNMRTSDEYDPLVRPYRGVVVITLNVLSFLLLVKCKQPIYHRNGTAFAPFEVDGFVRFGLDQEDTAVGVALLEMKSNLHDAWEAIKATNIFQKKEGRFYNEINSMLLLFQELFRPIEESANASHSESEPPTDRGSSYGGSGKSSTQNTQRTSVSGSEDGVSGPPTTLLPSSVISPSGEQGTTIGG
jgi:hypothetical protein